MQYDVFAITNMHYAAAWPEHLQKSTGLQLRESSRGDRIGRECHDGTSERVRERQAQLANGERPQR